MSKRFHARHVITAMAFLYLWVFLLSFLYHNYVLLKLRKKRPKEISPETEQKGFVVIPWTVDQKASIDPIPTDEDGVDSVMCKYQSISKENTSLRMIYPARYQEINCTGGFPDLVFRSGNFLKVNMTKVRGLLKPQEFRGCKYATVSMNGTVNAESVSDPFLETIELQPLDESIVVECFNTNFSAISRSYHSFIRIKQSVEHRCREKYEEHIREHNPEQTLSILIMGIPSLSKHHIRRVMPKTKEFLLKELHAIELNKHATVGEDALTQTLPLVSGFVLDTDALTDWAEDADTELLEDTFVWNDFRKAGYRTGVFWGETDMFLPNVHKRMPLWNRVDYNNRPLVMAYQGDKVVKDYEEHGACVGDVPELTRHLDLILQMATTFNNNREKPYIAFSHADTYLKYITDEYYLNFFKALKDRKVLNNTVVVFYSNHGMYFGEDSYKAVKVIESLSPFLFLAFPVWFHRKYPQLIEVLKINQWRLTTHFDIYETMQDLLFFTGNTYTAREGQNGISLFSEIPKERTCEDARVAPENCVCKGIFLENATIPTLNTILSAQALIDKVNSFVSRYRSRCKYLYRDTVLSIRQVRPEFLTFKKTNTDPQATVYEVRVTAKPGHAIYEAWVTFYKSSTDNPLKAQISGNYHAQVTGLIARLDPSSGTDVCIKDVDRQPFCHCRLKVLRKRFRSKKRKTR